MKLEKGKNNILVKENDEIIHIIPATAFIHKHPLYHNLILFTADASNLKSGITIRVDDIEEIAGTSFTGNMNDALVAMNDELFSTGGGDGLGSQVTFPIGMFMYSMKNTDHEGWVLCNGRNVNTLSASQQTALTNLGRTELPNMNQRILMFNADKDLGTSQGSNSKIIAKENLPALDLTGTTTAKNINYTDTQRNGSTKNGTKSNVANRGNNNVTRTLNIPELDVNVSLGGSDVPLSVMQAYQNENVFIYLG